VILVDRINEDITGIEDQPEEVCIVRSEERDRNNE
jgi:hypothetical protein